MRTRSTIYKPAILALSLLLGGCSSLLPRSLAVAESPWQSFEEAQQTFDKIIPFQTTVDDLKQLKLDPKTNPNIAILNYSDVLRRFLPGGSFNSLDLDKGVMECILAKTACKGYVVDQRTTKRNRVGNFWLDFLNFRRDVDIVGWHFNGVILVKDNLVIYKLTGGEPAIHQFENTRNPLGPLQGVGDLLINRF